MNDTYSSIREAIYRQLEDSPYMSDEELKRNIDERVFEFTGSVYRSTEDRLQLASRLFHSFRGLDVLQPLIDDPEITEIMINGSRHVFIEQGGEIRRSELTIESDEKLADLIQMMVGKVNRAVNESHPIVDARLSNGSRVHVVLPPIALSGPTVTIRKFPAHPYSLVELSQYGLMPDEVCQLLQKLVQAKYNVFIAGGTGSGKTTLLNAMAQYIGPAERVITIEDSAELKIKGIANLVGLETRNSNSEGKGQISMRDLIRASLRMRPDRIVVGEVRGAEAYDMLQAMNTGHDGSLSTGHANSVRDMLYRLETMVLGGMALPIEAIRRQVCSALDIVIHLSKFRDHVRRIDEICEITELEHGEIGLNPLYTVDKGMQAELIKTDKLDKAGMLGCRL
jgi:pilus assembly protein CpaF